MQIKLRVVSFLFIVGLSACASIEPTASIEPASEAEQPSTYSYTNPEKSGLKARQPFPTPNAVCVVLHSSSMTEPFEGENHFLIACPKHEKGAMDDHKTLQNAKVVGNAKHWVVMRIPLE